MRELRPVFLACALLAAMPVVSAGQSNDSFFKGWGPRIGLSIDPDQVHVGAHFDLGQLTRHVRLQPNLEVGFGDNRTLVALNFEAAYRFASRWNTWSPYVGGGLGITRVDPDRGGADTEAGVNFLGGIERGLSGGSRFFLEGKLGTDYAPDFKVTLGWTFR